MKVRSFGAAIACTLAIWNGNSKILMSAALADDDQVFKAYVLTLFSEPGKAENEFIALATTSPLLMSYAVGLFSENRCSTPHPSERLHQASGGDAAFQTEAGKKVFAVAGVVSTMKYPTAEAEARFCESARALLDTGEKYAEDHR